MMYANCCVNSVRLLCSPAEGGIKRRRDPSVRPSVCPIQRLGQATRAVRNADPSARGHRSAAIGMEGDIVLPCDSLFSIAFVMLFLCVFTATM